jgi:hypothetical protein
VLLFDSGHCRPKTRAGNQLLQLQETELIDTCTAATGRFRKFCLAKSPGFPLFFRHNNGPNIRFSLVAAAAMIQPQKIELKNNDFSSSFTCYNLACQNGCNTGKPSLAIWINTLIYYPTRDEKGEPAAMQATKLFEE